MKLVRSICFLLIVTCTCIYGQAKTTFQYIRNWPAGYDTTGVHWVVYNLYAAETKMLDEDSIDSFTAYNGGANTGAWRCNLGNFNGAPPWVAGDTIVAMGSIDTAYVADPGGYGDRINHTGYYWLYSDTVLPTTPEQITPDDTIRVMPKPIVYKTGLGGGANDTIWIKIANPRETRDTGQTDYDVLGYWLVADSTDTGTPNAYASPNAFIIGFIPVQGVFGDTTEYWMLESDGFEAWNTWHVWFAYKLVARPETSAVASCPGYATLYFSQNPDSSITVYQNVISVEEQKTPALRTQLQYVFPNPFARSTRISYSLAGAAQVVLKVYDVTGYLVQIALNERQTAGEHVAELNGENMPSGVYFYRLQAGDIKFSGRIVKLE